MHLLISYASSSDPGCQEAQRALKLPNLERLLALFPTLYLDEGSETSFSPPHERAHARALTGIDKPPRMDDGRFPWATWHVLQQNQNLDRSAAWAFITPCHWDVEADNIRMADPATLDISSTDSQALFAAMEPYFAGDGIALSYDSPGRWLATGDVFRGLPTAALDRVIGRQISQWMPEASRAKSLRRLQNEMQMLLYTHPVNDQRIARGQAEINSFWISGTGRESALIGAPLHSSFDSTFDMIDESQYVSAAPESHWHDFMPGQKNRPPTLEALTIYIPQALRDAALKQDWVTWAQAWKHIDATYCAKLLRAAQEAGAPTPGRPLPQLTLCGERSAMTFQAVPHTTLGRFTKELSSRFSRKPLHYLLEQL
jgi:hypothetical protein